MTPGRDGQRARVYAWEDAHVAPHDPTLVDFAAAQGMVDAIWADMGLRYPPRVERLPPHSSATLARGSRLVLGLPDRTPSWCLLHELAHAMSMTHDDQGDGHGPVFMGLYLRLLERYLRLPAAALCPSLDAAGIRVAADARPVFVD